MARALREREEVCFWCSYRGLTRAYSFSGLRLMREKISSGRYPTKLAEHLAQMPPAPRNKTKIGFRKRAVTCAHTQDDKNETRRLGRDSPRSLPEGMPNNAVFKALLRFPLGC